MTRPFALIALLALAVLAAGCGGSDDGAQDSDGGDSAASEAPAGLSLLILRDTVTNKLIAQSIADGHRWEFAVDPNEFVTAVDCSRDGQRAASLVRNLQTGAEVRFSGEQPSVPIAGEGFGLAWSPDSGRIAVTAYTPGSENRLDLLDPGTGALTTAATGSGPIGAPRWSPDGTKIAFDASNSTSNALFVYTLDQPSAVQLIERPAPVFAPDWSPDGNSLLFGAPSAAGNLSQIFTVGADGTNPREITSSGVSKGLPRWSPDGSLVAFAGTIVIPLASRRPATLHNLAVYTMKPDGTGEQAVTDVAQDAWLLGWCVSGPWLNDGWQEVVG